MKRLLAVFQTVCPTCQRFIKTAIALPIGKSAIYGCKECRTHLIHVLFCADGTTSQVTYLQNTKGGVSHEQIVTF